MRVTVDWSRCDGNGVCAAEAPTVFELDDADDLIVLTAEPAEELRPAVEAAVAACPKRALGIEA